MSSHIQYKCNICGRLDTNKSTFAAYEIATNNKDISKVDQTVKKFEDAEVHICNFCLKEIRR